jgi:hypothetical protein
LRSATSSPLEVGLDDGPLGVEERDGDDAAFGDAAKALFGALAGGAVGGLARQLGWLSRAVRASIISGTRFATALLLP